MLQLSGRLRGTCGASYPREQLPDLFSMQWLSGHRAAAWRSGLSLALPTTSVCTPHSPPLGSPPFQQAALPSASASQPLCTACSPCLSPSALWILLCVCCVRKPQVRASVWRDRLWALGHALKPGYRQPTAALGQASKSGVPSCGQSLGPHGGAGPQQGSTGAGGGL